VVVVFGGFGGAAVGAAGPVDLSLSAGTGRWAPRPFKTWSPGRQRMTILPTVRGTEGKRGVWAWAGHAPMHAMLPVAELSRSGRQK